MAQTRRKRQTKHRGNAAGFVESRGRTGRKPTAAEKSGNAAEAARAKQKRVDPRDKPPTWRGAVLRALVAACALALLSGLVLKASAPQTVAYFAVGLVAVHADQLLHRQLDLQAPSGQEGQAGGGKAASK